MAGEGKMIERWILVALLTLLSMGCVNWDITELNQSTAQQQLADADDDGVIDARDLCADTPGGAAVDNDGCPEKVLESIEIALELNFAHDSAELGEGDVQRIAALAKYLKQYPLAKAALGGHTSKVGSGHYNLRLGMKRAQAVRDVLVNQYGVEAERVEIATYGFRQLKRFGLGEDVDAPNRRVETQSGELQAERDVMKWTIYTPGR